MKRSIHSLHIKDQNISQLKKRKQQQQEEIEVEEVIGDGIFDFDDNLLFEVLKHVDARTLARASCVSRQWNRTAQDERLWELICTRPSASTLQLRSVVLALGGFRRLHSQFLLPLSSGSGSAPWLAEPVAAGAKPPACWGKDEVHLSLSLLSIRYYEKMNFSNRK